MLKCKHGKYYVGKTSKPVPERFQEHLSGNGSEWTKLHPPISVLESKIGDKWEEETTFYRTMEHYGINNVRGGSYSNISLTPDQINELNTKITAVNDVCYKCRQPGHFANKCPNSTINNKPKVPNSNNTTSKVSNTKPKVSNPNNTTSKVSNSTNNTAKISNPNTNTAKVSNSNTNTAKVSKANNNKSVDVIPGEAGVYVLALENDKWSVNYSGNMKTAVNAMLNGGTTKWTQTHKPLYVSKIFTGSSMDEVNTITLKLMKEFGWENVRGGTWSKVNMKTSPKELSEDKDECVVQ